MRRFLANRVSAIIIIGLSGRWDRYILQFLLGLAKERELLIADVKPDGPDAHLIERFRSIHYPSVVAKGVAIEEQAAYVRISLTADRFFEMLQL